MTGWRKRGEPTSQRRDGKGDERTDFLGQRRRRAVGRREPAAAVSIGGDREDGNADVYASREHCGTFL